jgi:hypothetical protein
MDIKGTPLRKVEERREERKFRAKDASKPRGGSATAETTRREERAGDKEEEGRTHVKREHPKTQNHQRCGQLWGGQMSTSKRLEQQPGTRGTPEEMQERESDPGKAS